MPGHVCMKAARDTGSLPIRFSQDDNLVATETVFQGRNFNDVEYCRHPEEYFHL